MSSPILTILKKFSKLSPEKQQLVIKMYELSAAMSKESQPSKDSKPFTVLQGGIVHE